MCSPATVLAHLTSLSNRWRVTEIQAGQAPPRRGYEDLLTRPVQAGEPAEDGVRNQHALEQAFLVEQESYLRDLFNQTLPHGYMTQLSTPLASQPVPAFWQQLEVDFGQNNAMGMVDMIQEFEAALAMDFGSEAELFQRIRSRDCPKRKADMANGVGRKDIFSEPRPLKMRKTDHARVQKMQPAQATARKEIPVDAAALQRLNISDETPRQSDGDVPTTPGSYDMVSTDGRSTPPSPAVSSSAAGDSDEDMDEFDRHKVTPANSVAVLSVAEELEEKAQAFEEKDAGTD
ncbi:hypothetical protein PF006_g8135 [Phytophthora fragariae]|uniref:Uncharacterized protein n=1 Tax=Phytophthora fragariae TaxID=53985 RepID=A0A6A3U6M9_9STRA|nr:hypothetical protein PF006_g8135 [Phytophthora fragariae]